MSRRNSYIPSSEDEPPLGQDAIPKNAIRLTDAFWSVFKVLDDHSEILPEFDELWRWQMEFDL